MFFTDVEFQSWNILLFISLINSVVNYFYLALSFVYILNYIGVFFLFVSVLFVFDVSKLKQLNQLKTISNSYFFTFAITISVLSMAGFPPFLGFLSKVVLFFGLMRTKTFFLVVLLTIVNFFIIYFYIHNLRFLSSRLIYSNFYIKNHYVFLSFNLVLLLVSFLFLNIFGGFLLNELNVLVISLVSNLSFL